MSVDKFGRYDQDFSNERSRKAAGFPKTESGDYNAENRSIRNVKGPIVDSDVATKGYVLNNSLTPNADGDYDFKNRVITNLGEPRESSDAATLGFVIEMLPTDVATTEYVKNYTLSKTTTGDFNVNNKRLLNVQDPLIGSDAANRNFVEKSRLKRTHTGGDFDMEGKRIRNVGYPLLPTDVATVRYMSDNIPKVGVDYWGFSNKRLSNVLDPTSPGEAVNLGTLKKLTLHRNIQENRNYDAQSLKISNVGDCEEDGDAVNKKMLRKQARKWNGELNAQIEKLGAALFNYIHHSTGRSADSGLDSTNFLDWNDIHNSRTDEGTAVSSTSKKLKTGDDINLEEVFEEDDRYDTRSKRI